MASLSARRLLPIERVVPAEGVQSWRATNAFYATCGTLLEVRLPLARDFGGGRRAGSGIRSGPFEFDPRHRSHKSQGPLFFPTPLTRLGRDICLRPILLKNSFFKIKGLSFSICALFRTLDMRGDAAHMKNSPDAAQNGSIDLRTARQDNENFARNFRSPKNKVFQHNRPIAVVHNHCFLFFFLGLGAGSAAAVIVSNFVNQSPSSI